ncbi:YgdI/YgdR family lipoprotein [Pantoea sp. 1.19]|uniref:YgdI/YgdR family lipoprotein n=1 Tax=Pantoea sp. 1.19 TaxID=1925589 RepID=UPI000948D8D8|nr:YgdI/YgdR family lipoprotein [Pantoea sp. 1.19]
MKESLRPGLLMLVALMLAGCASQPWMMQMKNGQTVVVDGKPQLDQASGMMMYTDERGIRQAVNSHDVVTLRPVEK